MKNSTTSTELVKANSTDPDEKLEMALARLSDVAESAPAELRECVTQLVQLTNPSIKGVEGKQHTTIPSIYLRQKISSSAAMPASVKIGGMYDSNAEVLPEELEIIPILRHPARQKWEDSQLDCRSIDGISGTRYGKCDNCPHGQYVEGKQTLCNSGHTFYIALADLSAIYRVNFFKSSAPAGKNILRMSKPPALWARTFLLSSEKKLNGKIEYFVFNTRPSGNKLSPEKMEVCDALHDFFRAGYEKALASLEENSRVEEANTTTVETTGSGVIDFNDTI